MAAVLHELQFEANQYVEKKNDLLFHVHRLLDDNQAVFEDSLSLTKYKHIIPIDDYLCRFLNNFFFEFSQNLIITYQLIVNKIIYH